MSKIEDELEFDNLDNIDLDSEELKKKRDEFINNQKTYEDDGECESCKI